MVAKEYFNTRKRKSIGLSRNRFDQLCEFSIEELNDYLDEDFEKETLKEKVKKGSNTNAFIQVPQDILNNEINTEEDRLLFLFDCLLFTYARPHNVLYYNKDVFFEYFNLKPMLNKDAKKIYCKKYKYVELTYKRGFGYAISYCDYTENIPCSSDNNIIQLDTNKNKINEIKNKMNEIEKQYVFDKKLIDKDSDYRSLKKELENLI